MFILSYYSYIIYHYDFITYHMYNKLISSITQVCSLLDSANLTVLGPLRNWLESEPIKKHWQVHS